jgi:protein-S-isoprenylcysteine O-methyltransferase Ste14
MLIKQLVVTFLLVIVTLFVFRIIVKKEFQNKGRLTAISTFFQLLIFFLHGLSSYVYINTKGNQTIGDNFLENIGIIFMVIGGLVTLIGMINLGIRNTFGIIEEGLNRTGFYKYSRNPQIVFYILFITGYALIYPGWSALLWIGTLLFMCHVMVFTEEEHLLRTFNNEYKEYCVRTPRYIGIQSFYKE